MALLRQIERQIAATPLAPVARRLKHNVRDLLGIVPASAPAAAAQGLLGVIRTSLQEEQIGQPQIAAIEAAFRAAPDKRVAADALLSWFTLHPEKCRLIVGSQYYFNTYPDSSALRLMAIAADFAAGNYSRAARWCDDLKRVDDSDIARALESRIAWAAEGLDAEHRAIDRGLQQFPESLLLHLHLILHHITRNEIAAANTLINRHIDEIRADLADELGPAAENQTDLAAAIAEGRKHIPAGKDIYDDKFCRLMWLSYYESFHTRNPRQHGDAAIQQQYLGLIDNLAAADTAVIIDFGAMCGQWLYDAALKYPAIQFFGSDRQKLVRDMNEQAYPLPNLHFRDGDIYDCLSEAAKLPGRKAVTHVRTSCVMYPAFMQEFYGRCASEFGIDRIAFIENAGMSRLTFSIADFDNMKTLTHVTKHKLYLHNYKKLLADAGYRISHWQRQPTLSLWNGLGVTNYVGSGLIVEAVRA